VNSAEIEEAFAEIAVEVAHLAGTLERIAGEIPEPGSQTEWETSLVCASAIEKIYTGCERMMARLAASVDGEKIAHEGNWHRQLLDRMQQPFGARGPIISQETFELLDRMRSFRHRARNSYGHGLRFTIVIDRAADMIRGFNAFAADVRQSLNGPPKDL
jgi:hypothetical protein